MSNLQLNKRNYVEHEFFHNVVFEHRNIASHAIARIIIGLHSCIPIALAENQAKPLKMETMCKFGTPTPNNSPISTTICVYHDKRAVSTKVYTTPFSHGSLSGILQNPFPSVRWMRPILWFDALQLLPTMASIHLFGVGCIRAKERGIMIFLRAITMCSRYGQVQGQCGDTGLETRSEA